MPAVLIWSLRHNFSSAEDEWEVTYALRSKLLGSWSKENVDALISKWELTLEQIEVILLWFDESIKQDKRLISGFSEGEEEGWKKWKEIYDFRKLKQN